MRRIKLGLARFLIGIGFALVKFGVDSFLDDFKSVPKRNEVKPGI